MTSKQRRRSEVAKQLATWTDEQLAHAWNNPNLRKDGSTSIKGANFCDRILDEQNRRRVLFAEITERLN